MGMFSARKRGRIFHKTDGHCGYCGVELDPFTDWHVDHMIPQAFGGGGEANLIASCRSCNSRKNRKDVEQFRAAVIPAMLTHADALRGPYASYLTPQTASELAKLAVRARELLEGASIIFYLDNSGE